MYFRSASSITKPIALVIVNTHPPTTPRIQLCGEQAARHRTCTLEIAAAVYRRLQRTRRKDVELVQSTSQQEEKLVGLV